MGDGREMKPGTGSLTAETTGTAATLGALGKRTLTEGLQGPMRVTVTGLNVRSTPSKAGRENVVATLPRDTRVEVRGAEGEWAKIDYRDQLAFVFGRYIEPLAPAAEPGLSSSPAARSTTRLVTSSCATSSIDPHPVADPEHVSAPPTAAPTAETTRADRSGSSPASESRAVPPTMADDSPAAGPGGGHAPLPLDHMGRFTYQVAVGETIQQVLVYVAAGQLTLTPDVFVFFHGQWANYGIDPKQLADRRASEQARIEREKSSGKDPKKVRGDETTQYVESGRDSSAEAMQHAEGRNVIAILSQGVMGGAGSNGGHMSVLTAKGGGLPALIDSVMASLQHDLHGDRMKPGRISIAGHSAGGYMGVHEALANAGEDRDTITDVTLMDAEYSGAQFQNASAWLLRGKGGKSLRIVASPSQLATGLHVPFFGPKKLGEHAEAKGFTVVDKGGAGEPRGPKTTVISHAQIMKGSEVHADVLILKTQMGHHQIRDNVMDDAILNIGQGDKGGGDTFGALVHGATPKAATSGPGYISHDSAQGPAPDASIKAADSNPLTAAESHTDVIPAPQHSSDPKAPETPAAPTSAAASAQTSTSGRIKVPSNSASSALYAPGGVLNVEHLTHGKGNALDEQEYDFKQRVYVAATEARMTSAIFGGLPDDDLAHITGVPMPDTQRYRKILLPSLHSLLSAMDADGNAGKEVGGKSAKDYKGVGVVSGYRGPKQEMALWDGYFQQYLAKTQHEREKTGDPFGKKSVELLVKYIGKRKAPPGHSNHSNGTAVDLWALSKTHEIHNKYDNQAAWFASWHYAWLKANAASHNFRNYPAEAWHWEYIT